MFTPPEKYKGLIHIAIFFYPNPTITRTHPKTCFVTRSSEKTEAKAAGQKGSSSVPLHIENLLYRQRRHRALQPIAVKRGFWDGF